MTPTSPLVCHECWAKHQNWYGACPHARDVFEAGRKRGAQEAQDYASVNGHMFESQEGFDNFCRGLRESLQYPKQAIP